MQYAKIIVMIFALLLATTIGLNRVASELLLFNEAGRLTRLSE